MKLNTSWCTRLTASQLARYPIQNEGTKATKLFQEILQEKMLTKCKIKRVWGKNLAKKCIKSQNFQKFVPSKYDAVNKYDIRRTILHFNLCKS